jgi:hypothetical protein
VDESKKAEQVAQVKDATESLSQEALEQVAGGTKAKGDKVEYLTVKLTEVMISNYQVGGS